MTKKLTRKQLLKEPDEFITTTGKIIQFGTRYQKQIAYIAGAFFLLVAGFSAWRYMDYKAENRAYAMLAQISQKYEQLAIDGDAESAYAGIRTEFEAFLDDFGNTDGGQIGRIAFGNVCYRAGEYDQALVLYQKGRSAFETGSFYGQLLDSNLGYTYAAKGDTEAAIGVFKRLVDDAAGELRAQVLFQLANLYEQKGQIEESRDAYQKIVADHTDSIFIDVAREKLSS